MPAMPTAVSDRVESVRLAIAGALRDRVIGDNAEEKRDAIMNATGPRWFSESSPLHIVHSDSSMFIGNLNSPTARLVNESPLAFEATTCVAVLTCWPLFIAAFTGEHE